MTAMMREMGVGMLQSMVAKMLMNLVKWASSGRHPTADIL
jgi:hypothetical protein